MQTSITPTNITVWPNAAKSVNTLTIQICRAVDDSGRCGYTYQLSDVQPVSPPTVPPTYTTTQRASGSSEVTAAQWAAWSSGGTMQSDEEYQLECIATNLGLVIP